MSKRPYQHLPPLEHRPDGSPYRITPPQKRRASGLIRRECCNCEDGNCLALDDGDTCACPQMISFSVCCKWFRWAVLPLDRTLGSGDLPGQGLETPVRSAAGVFVPKSNRGKYCPDCAARVHRRQKTESERKRRSAVGQLRAGKALICKAPQALNRGGWYHLSFAPGKRASNRPQNTL